MGIPPDLEKAATERGLKVVERGQGHFQITGGPLLVNYYPLAKRRSAYVAGTTGRRVGVTAKQAVEMAFLPPERRGLARKDERRGKYRAKIYLPHQALSVGVLMRNITLPIPSDRPLVLRSMGCT